MLALHLLQSALVHVNTLLLQAVLEDPEFHDLLDRRAETRHLASFSVTPWHPRGVAALGSQDPPSLLLKTARGRTGRGARDYPRRLLRPC